MRKLLAMAVLILWMTAFIAQNAWADVVPEIPAGFVPLAAFGILGAILGFRHLQKKK